MWNLRRASGGRSGGSDACDGQALKYVSRNFLASLLMLLCSKPSSHCAGLSTPVETSEEVLGDRGFRRGAGESTFATNRAFDEISFVTNRAFDFACAATQLAFRWAICATFTEVSRS